eukprot:519384-Rhodomonas_salina.2
MLCDRWWLSMLPRMLVRSMRLTNYFRVSQEMRVHLRTDSDVAAPGTRTCQQTSRSMSASSRRSETTSGNSVARAGGTAGPGRLSRGVGGWKGLHEAIRGRKEQMRAGDGLGCRLTRVRWARAGQVHDDDLPLFALDRLRASPLCAPPRPALLQPPAATLR